MQCGNRLFDPNRHGPAQSSEGGYFGSGNAQLPAPPMPMNDRITELSLDGGEFGKGHDRDFFSSSRLALVLAPRFIQQWEESRLLLKRDARYF